MPLFQMRRLSPAMQLLLFLCLYFLGSLLLLGVLSLLMQALHIDMQQAGSKTTALSSSETIGVLSMTVLSQLLTFLLPALVFIYLIPERPKLFLSFKKIQPSSTLWIFIMALGTLSLVLGSAAVLQSFSFGKGADSLQQQRRQLESAMLQMNNIGDLLLRIGVIALLPAICEEIFFRGIIQRFANTFLKNPVWSILIVGCLFASFHGSIYNFLPVAIAGIILGLVYHYTGNIWYNVILHFINNAIQVIQVYWISKHPEMDIEAIPLLTAAIMTLAGTAVVYLAFKQAVKGNTAFPKNWGMPGMRNQSNLNLS